MIDSAYAIAVIVGMAVITILLRAMPFLVAPLLKRYTIIGRLGRFLPPAIMTLLTLHTLHGSAAENHFIFWPEFLAIGIAIVLQLWMRHALVSIVAATALYIAFRNATFFG